MALAGISACGSYTTPSTVVTLDSGQQCSSDLPTTALAPYQSVGSGIIIGTDVSASVCNVGVIVYASPDSSSPDQLLVRLDYY